MDNGGAGEIRSLQILTNISEESGSERNSTAHISSSDYNSHQITAKKFCATWIAIGIQIFCLFSTIIQNTMCVMNVMAILTNSNESVCPICTWYGICDTENNTAPIQYATIRLFVIENKYPCKNPL